MLETGNRVFVTSYQSWATVEYIYLNEIYSVGVTLDTPDEDGHNYKHVGMGEIKLTDKQGNKNPLPIELPSEETVQKPKKEEEPLQLTFEF